MKELILNGINVENIISEEKVKSDIETIIDDIYNGNKTEIDTTEIEENINTEVTKILGKTTASLMQASINEFIEEVCDEYKTQMESLNSTELDRYADTAFEYVDKVILYDEIAIAVCVVLIILLSLPMINKGILKFGVVFEIDGIIFAVLGKFANGLVEEAEISAMGLEKIVYSIFDTMLNYGYIFVAIGLVCIIVSEAFVYGIKKKRNNVDLNDDF